VEALRRIHHLLLPLVPLLQHREYQANRIFQYLCHVGTGNAAEKVFPGMGFDVSEKQGRSVYGPA
jgi:hypothetical protein